MFSAISYCGLEVNGHQKTDFFFDQSRPSFELGAFPANNIAETSQVFLERGRLRVLQYLMTYFHDQDEILCKLGLQIYGLLRYRFAILR